MTEIPGPHGPAALRSARAMLARPADTIEALATEYGRTFAIHLGPTKIVVVGDRELVKVVLTGPQEQFRWGPVFKLPLGVFVGPTSMLVSDGDDHARRRSLVQPAFALRRLQSWHTLIVDEFDRMIDEFPLNEPFDLAPRLQTTIRRIVVRVLFGAELAAGADDIGERLAPAAEYLNRPFGKQLPHPFPWGARERARASRRSFDARLDQEIARRRASSDDTSDDVLDALLAVKLTERELKDQVVSLIGAGFDTTTASASWLVLRAAADPDVWRRLREEANTAPEPGPYRRGSRPDGASSGGEQLGSAPTGPAVKATERTNRYAEAVVHESLRIHPAGAYAPQVVAQSFDLGAYRLRRGSLIAWSPLLTGRDPASWPDPLRFDPARHLDGDEPEYAWVPFGAGGRSCLGFGLARLNLTLVASRLAQRVDLTLASHEIPGVVGTVTGHPIGGVPVTVTARH